MYRKKEKRRQFKVFAAMVGAQNMYRRTGQERGKRKKEKVEPGAGVSQVLSLGAMGVNKVRADGISWRS